MDHPLYELAHTRQLLRWLWQNGSTHPEGIKIRAIVACHACLPELQSLSLTQMAAAFGKHKQSLGRWRKDFERDFKREFGQ